MEAFQELINGMCRRFNEIDQAEGYAEFEFLDAVRKDLETVNSTGVINFTFHNKNEDTSKKNQEKDHRNRNTKSSITMDSNVKIKLEKLSENPFESSSEMPPPQLPVKRAKKIPAATIKTEPMRNTRSKTAAKKKNIKVESTSSSCEPLSDMDDEAMSLVATEGPSLQIKKEKLSTFSSEAKDDGGKSRVTRSTRTNSSWKQSSVYEDCIGMPQTEQLNDATFTLPQQNNNAMLTHNNQATMEMNTTFCKIVQNKTIVINEPTAILTPPNGVNANALMTDDESMQESNIPVKYPTRTVEVKKAAKPVFSPFENSPVKKRVAAFEKLKTDGSTGLISRMKTKNKAKQGKENEDQAIKINEPQMKIKSKITPQMTSKMLIPYVNSASKVMNHSSALTNEIKLPLKAFSAVKATQQEFKEREIQRREKDLEAARKKEELRQLQMEEAKRKRQQVREEQERIKQKQMELQKLKEEKYKQALVEKQQKRQKQQEEIEKKRLQVMKKAMERRQKEKLNLEKNEAKVKNTEKKEVPFYMTQKAPPLPTVECYDSDEEQCPNVKVLRPPWQQDEKKLKAQQHMVTKVTYTFFCCESQTPDLRDIFENIDPQKLKRNSSAIWHKAPRFTMLPVGDSFNENEDEEE